MTLWLIILGTSSVEKERRARMGHSCGVALFAAFYRLMERLERTVRAWLSKTENHLLSLADTLCVSQKSTYLCI